MLFFHALKLAWTIGYTLKVETSYNKNIMVLISQDSCTSFILILMLCFHLICYGKQVFQRERRMCVEGRVYFPIFVTSLCLSHCVAACNQ
jgi:hypothetical protein